MELTAFHRLAAGAFPTLLISVAQQLDVTTLYTTLTYTIRANGAMLPAEVKVTGSSAEEAIGKLRPAIAKVRRAHETEKLLGGLEAEWTEFERAGMRQRLMSAWGRDGFEAQAALIRSEDKRRYDLAMDQDYEQSGAYDQGPDYHEEAA